MTIALIISIVALTISFILFIRLFLLDKEYCEFVIDNYGDDNNGLTSETLKQKEGYVITILRPTIRIIKGDMYDIKISGINKNNITPYKKCNITDMKCGDTLQFNHWYCKPTLICIFYKDSKNNLYKQNLKISPFYVGNMAENNRKYSIVLYNRKWQFIKSIAKYF